MDEKSAIAWFEALEKRVVALEASRSGGRGPWAEVTAEMQSALENVLPPAHTLLRRWEDARQRGKQAIRGNMVQTPETWVIDELIGIFRTGLTLLKDGHLRRLSDGIRAETIGQCLDQAETLAHGGYVVAAMVLAGGGLETHLRDLCDRFALSVPSDGSISKYDQALGTARKQGTQNVVTAGDSNLIGSWGKDRNTAAHTPAQFSKSKEEVLLSIEGIRQFLARSQ